MNNSYVNLDEQPMNYLASFPGHSQICAVEIYLAAVENLGVVWERGYQ